MAKKITSETVVHGTPSGAKWHYREKVQICDPCRFAANEYERQRRARAIALRPLTREKAIQELQFRTRQLRELIERTKLEGRVLKRLAALHPYDYKRIMDEEIRRRKAE